MFPTTLSISAQKSLALLGGNDILHTAYLAGGSSLALQIGHRRSIDFDFFSKNKFDSKQVKEKLALLGVYKEVTRTADTMIGIFDGAKFSLFNYPYKLIDKTILYQGINLASPKDIAAMKLVAITDRGTKKDYVDLYFMAIKLFALDKMFEFYDKKYNLFETNKMIILKSLQYFVDADDSEMPEMIEEISWDDVKNFFGKEAVRLAKKYI